MNTKTPSAQEFFADLFGTDRGSKQAVCYMPDVIKRAKEFADIHRQSALEAAAQKAQIERGLTGRFPHVDKDSILNAYPLENIK